MRIAGLQMDIAWEDVEVNLARADELARRAVDEGARLLVLPEMFATGFTMRPHLAAAAGEASLQALSRIAREHGVWIAGGLVEPARPDGPGSGRGRPSNLCVILDPEGREALRYSKIHPFSLAGEHDWIEPGDRLATVLVDDVRVCPLICYDLRFPEVFRAAAKATDLFVVIANWPEKRGHAWRTLLMARAIENQAWVLGVNRVGDADGSPHRGDSGLIDPMGETVASLAGEEGLVLGEIDRERVARCRARLGFLGDRRPGLYRELSVEEAPAPPEREGA